MDKIDVAQDRDRWEAHANVITNPRLLKIWVIS